ncbi:MAG: XisI protein [Leptospiraceae bacterium]|nr:XisI protein [Leptospiraceae bacterium]
MEKLEHYYSIILDVINFYGSLKPEGDEHLTIEKIIDRENKRFALFSIGWENSNRIHDCIIHIDIIDDKVYIQEDTTDLPIARVLEDKGISNEDLVLSYMEK